MTEYRASFDATVTFANGGGLAVQGFRVDVRPTWTRPTTATPAAPTWPRSRWNGPLTSRPWWSG